MEALVLEEPPLFEAHRLKWSSINYGVENEILNTTSECENQHGVPGRVYCIEVSDLDAGENIIKLKYSPHLDDEVGIPYLALRDLEVKIIIFEDTVARTNYQMALEG
jgi:hypothetical protein